ncbi:hypothetical protein GCM10011360_32920 [Primorskyibacter flagellatus]|uniref:VPLPA-CTERM protein sorting domain-containing protein n=1 Tax=Primorskyibacter flagellatus TaxID=1387277 RepID=A0A917AD74_9RHOB|nr:VPLPA-CTERM sorting domain-containing protein [Primorskyibacter flagellatus]GGE42970.1 hypothetical protein GCM10011360_32920 [Primorskyibacter flagellatus]
MTHGFRALALTAALVCATQSDAATYTVFTQVGSSTVELQFDSLDAKLREIEDLKALSHQWWNDAFGGFVFVEDTNLNPHRRRLIMLTDADPWMMFEFRLENHDFVPAFYALDIRMRTDVISGPTHKEAFLDLELIDSDSNGYVASSSTSAYYTVIDDDGGPLINASEGLANSAFGTFLSGEGTHTLFDVAGPGPDSDMIDATDGFNYMRFTINGYLSPGDSLILSTIGCYGADAAACPAGFTLPDSLTAVPLPASLPVLLSGIGLLALRRNRRN